MNEPINIMGVVAFPNEDGNRDCRFSVGFEPVDELLRAKQPKKSRQAAKKKERGEAR